MPLVVGRIQQRIEAAGIIEGVKLVASADVLIADEDLRHGRLSIRTGHHLCAKLPISTDVDLRELNTLAVEQFLRPLAILAIGSDVDLDRAHSASEPKSGY